MLIALLAVAVALGVGELIQPWLGIENVDLVFLTAVVGVAVRYGLWPSLFASVAASLCYNFFFLPPIYTFTITDPTNVAAFVFFIVMAVIVSNVAARGAHAGGGRDRPGAHDRVALRVQPQACRRRHARRRAVGDRLSDRADAEGAGRAAAAGERLDRRQGRLSAGGHARRGRSRRRQMGLGERSRRPGAAPIRCPAPSGCSCRCAPAAAPIGVVGIDSDKPGPLLTPDQRRLLDALIDQGALAIERVRLVEDMDRVKRTVETDRLRSALLTSISHDLKTPLAAVLGAAGTLRDLVGKLSDAEKAELLATIIDESERLNRFIANLLDMTKLESGAIVPNAALHDLGEIVGSALRRAGKILAQHQVELELAAGSADARARCGAVRAGAVQSPRQRREICARRHDDPHPELARRRFGLPAGAGRGRRHSAGRSGAHLRQVLSRAEGRSGARRHRARARDLARLRRGDARHDRRGQPHRPDAARCSRSRLPIPADAEQLDTAA